MKVLVVGAAGRTGRAVVDRAVQAGHEVTALVHAAGFDVPDVTARIGDAGDEQITEAAVSGQDAVIDTVGGRTPYRRTTMETRVATAVVRVMQRSGARRLVVTSSIGVGDSTAHTPLLTRILVATFLRGSTRDQAGMEDTVRASELDWGNTRPAVLTDKPSTGQVRVLSAGTGEVARSLTRTDLAAFLVEQLSSDAHLHTAVTIANR